MRSTLVISALCLSLGSLSAVATQASELPWRSDLKAARAEAEQTGKLVLVHFWMPNCPPCAALERDVFSQPQVTQIMQERFVLVKINAVDSRSTADDLGVTNVPADVFLTPQGEVLNRSISPNSPMAYIAHVSKIASKHKLEQGTAFDKAVANAPGQVPNTAYGKLNIPIAENAPHTNEVTPSGSAAPNQVHAAPTAVANPYATAPAVAKAASSASLEPGATSAGPVNASQTNGNSSSGGGDRYAMNNSVVDSAATDPYARVGAQQPNAQNSLAQPSASATMPANTVDNGVATNSAATPGMADTRPSSATSPPASPSATAATVPTASPPLGFDGYCPVSTIRQVGQLPESRWKMVPGDKRFGLEHRGKVYLFANEECRQAFYENPDHFSPALAGLDPVLFLENSQSAPGTIKHGVEYNGQIYLFSSEQTLNRFRQHAEQYATGVRQAMQSAPSRIIR